MSHTTWVEISRSALLHNARTLRGHVAPTGLMAVVKGNAYGHGQSAVTHILRDEVDWFGVNSLAEGKQLRDDSHGTPTLILGSTPPEQAYQVVRGGFRQAVYDLDLARALSEAAVSYGATVGVHLKVETGTNRQGLRGESLRRLAAEVRALPGLALEGLYTHYANIEEAADFSFAGCQLERFRAEVATIERDGPVPVKHTACSAAAILYPQTYYSLVRTGIALYGLWPSEDTRLAADAGVTLRPVLAWKARVAQVKEVPAGEAVGYGCTARLDRPSRIAVLPAGYYEGYDRGLSNQGTVLIRGQRAPVTGRICMNMFMVDVTDIPGAAAGDEAVLLGAQGNDAIPAEEMAARLDTINYEVVTRIGASVPRLIVD